MKALLLLRYGLEAVAVSVLLALFRLIGLDAASALGGALLQWLGPLTKAHRSALRNLERIYPAMPLPQRHAILRQSWNNLGRVAGEFPHIATPLMATRISIEGAEHVEAARKTGKPILFYSAHYGNWELCARVAKEQGFNIALIYRPANNRWVDAIMLKVRRSLYSAFYEKGPQGARELLKALDEGTHIAMLVDQKMNDGITVPFMGIPAMTAPALARFALKHGSPMLGCRITRVKGAYFKVTLSPLLYADSSKPRHEAIQHSMEAVNEEIGRWVHEDPGQWFWMHNRWPKA